MIVKSVILLEDIAIQFDDVAILVWTAMIQFYLIINHLLITFGEVYADHQTFIYLISKIISIYNYLRDHIKLDGKPFMFLRLTDGDTHIQTIVNTI